MRVGEEKHILVVDDEPEICRLVSGYLTKEGYRVDAVANGAGMREVLAAQAVDLVILDLGLPGEEGLELARAARRVRHRHHHIDRPRRGRRPRDRSRDRRRRLPDQAGFTARVARPGA